MLQIIIDSDDEAFFDSEENVFVSAEKVVLNLEHSLISVSKWETIWKTPFLTDKPKTPDQTLSYIKCMTINGSYDISVYSRLSVDQIKRINKYIDSNLTATSFYENASKDEQKATVTSELIYYWMLVYNIPFECQKWHLSRLLTLIHICVIKNDTKKMSTADTVSRNRALNEERKKAYNSKG